MAKALRLILLLLLLAVLAYLAWPWISAAMYTARLSFMQAPSSLPIPVAGVARRQLRDTWHASRPPARQHEGIDIFARKGTAVVAATEGVVMRREETRLGGKVVWVFGPGGQRHYYAHLDDYGGFFPGDRVVAGSLLGYVGNTGNARTTPPHLHYGIYTQSGPINPYPLLSADSNVPDARN